MNEVDNSPTCERADDLVAVLYGEAGERERRDFELHLTQCGSCRAEFAAFAQVRESIGEWRDESLTGFAHTAALPARKSALAAVRQFFDLSPLWLKGAVGFAAVILFALAALAVFRLRPTEAPPQVAGTNPDAAYTKQDLDRAVQEALAKQQHEQRAADPQLATITNASNDTEPQKPRIPNVVKSEPRARRPFSRAEREQLAADLRLLSGDEEADLEGLEDRINRQR